MRSSSASLFEVLTTKEVSGQKVSGSIVMRDTFVLLRNTNQDDDTLMQLGGPIEGDKGESRERWTEWTSQNHSDSATEVPLTKQCLSSQEGEGTLVCGRV